MTGKIDAEFSISTLVCQDKDRCCGCSYLYRMALQPYSVIIDSSMTSYDGCWAIADATMVASAATVTAESLLLDENLAVDRIGKFSPLLRLRASITVINCRPSVERTGMLDRVVQRESSYSTMS